MRLRRWLRSAVALSVMVAVAGIAGTTGVAAVLFSDQRREADSQLERRSELMAEAVTTEAGRYVDTLRTVAAATAALETVTAGRFGQVAAPLRRMNLAGATSVAFLVPSTDAQVPEVQALWRSRGAPDITLTPVGTGREHIFSIFSEPLDGGLPAATGTDVTQLPAPDQAFTQARRTGQTTVSDTYLLLRDRDVPPDRRQLSFILTAPVYEAPDAAGRQAFRGWVLMGIRGQDFIGATLRRISQNLLDVTLQAQSADGAQVAVATLRATVPGDRDLRREVDVTMAQRQWQLMIQAPSTRLPGAGGALPTTVALGGGALSLLLAGLVYVLATGRTRAQNQVRAATAQLSAAETEARGQANLLEVVLNSITDGVAVVDTDGEFLLHNPAARRILDVDPQGPRPDAWQAHYGIYRSDGSVPFPVDEQPLVRALAGERTDGVEMIVRNARHPNGVRIAVSGRPLGPGAGQAGAMAVFHDVTLQHAREAELTSFAGMVAHDLRTPLTVVAGYAELLSDAVETAELRAPLTQITAGVDRMSQLIHDLLVYATARDASLHSADIDLAEIAADVVTMITASMRPEGDPVPRITVGALPTVRADPNMIRQLLDNLIGNAIKYTPPGEAARIDLSAYPDKPGWVRIEVSDHGIGVPEGQHEAIFAGFHRAHADGPYAGTGLGLAICKHIVDRHGGAIAVTDNPGGGSRFSFTLPLGDPSRPGGK
ncbi:ATP-binding protein [Longispora sp. K20-0274]|uniref:ATP-binding protein n=1 Tax=Longispora sp. K20-0274 TaxID=3088255 RepID=UPI0039997C5C